MKLYLNHLDGIQQGIRIAAYANATLTGFGLFMSLFGGLPRILAVSLFLGTIAWAVWSCWRMRVARRRIAVLHFIRASMIADGITHQRMTGRELDELWDVGVGQVNGEAW